jgi:hypothetical protein
MMQQFKISIWAALVCFAAISQPVQAAFGGSMPLAAEENCPNPTVTVTGQGTDSFTFDITSESGTVQYKYTHQETGAMSGWVTVGNGSTSVSNLPAGTYKFHFRSVCGNQASEGGGIIIDDLLSF